ncbi:protein of unknown function [Paenibacillus alvei]|uniref:Uncharacterized protein n=1 Tax=Paenibacillus alvei TaxID=44250 RepID=A0A383RIF9_PAEAL|nr:protein of unknown function [Paenibacillus alvei]
MFMNVCKGIRNKETVSESEMKILLTTHIFRCIIFNNK